MDLPVTPKDCLPAQFASSLLDPKDKPPRHHGRPPHAQNVIHSHQGCICYFYIAVIKSMAKGHEGKGFLGLCFQKAMSPRWQKEGMAGGAVCEEQRPQNSGSL